MDIPELNKTQQEVERQTRTLIPWLEDPHTCECGALCIATEEFVESQAIYMDVWKCRQCESLYHRTRD